MNQDKIKKEYCSLMLEQLKATAACNYYSQHSINVLEDMKSKLEEYKELQAKTDLTEEAKQKQFTQLDELSTFLGAAQEHYKFLERMHDKAQRKLNEVEKKLASFCKRHGIEEC